MPDIRHIARSAAAVAMFVAGIWMVYDDISMERIVASCNSRSRVSEELDDAVCMVGKEVPRSESLTFYESDLSQLDALHRQVVAAVAFDRIPSKVPVSDGKIDDIDSDWVLTGRYSPAAWRLKMGDLRYRLVAETSQLSLFSKLYKERSTRPGENDGRLNCCWQSIFAAVIIFTMVGFLTAKLSGVRIRLSPSALVAIASFGTALAVLCIMTHTLRSPNGTAVYAGKAKLWLLCGIPDGYWEDSAWTVFLPAYPPAMAALSYLYYALAGKIDNYIVQIVPFSGVFWCMFVLFARAQGAMWKSFVLIVFSMSTPIYIAAGFYPEGFVALAIVLALSRIENHDLGWRTWAIAGVAAMFKNEGIMFYAVLAFAVASTMRADRSLLLWEIIGVLPAVIWHVLVWMSGGGVDGYELNSLGVTFSHCQMAISGILKSMFDWQSGALAVAAFPIAAIYSWPNLDEAYRRMSILITAFVIASLFAIVLVYGACSDWNISWRIDSSLFRLIWTPITVSIWGALAVVYGRERHFAQNEI